MGLDTFAVRPASSPGPDEAKYEVVEDDPDFEGINLTGGMLSGHGPSGSFRGKVYDEVVEAVTGETLYQEEIADSAVERMATRLEVAVHDHQDEVALGDEEVEVEGHLITFEDLKGLAHFFRVCANKGYMIHGWW